MKKKNLSKTRLRLGASQEDIPRTADSSRIVDWDSEADDILFDVSEEPLFPEDGLRVIPLAPRRDIPAQD